VVLSTPKRHQQFANVVQHYYYYSPCSSGLQYASDTTLKVQDSPGRTARILTARTRPADFARIGGSRGIVLFDLQIHD